MAKKPKEQPETGPNCGNCRHWKRCNVDGENIGECFFNPPVVQVDEEGYSIVRPILDASERACGRFTGAQ